MAMFFGDMRPRWAKPEATLPGVVAVELLLARTDTAAIALTGIRAFPTGFEFTLSCVTRNRPWIRRANALPHDARPSSGRWRTDP